jgi:DNA-directed RNA polymerase subunit RPC12/RpoP
MACARCGGFLVMEDWDVSVSCFHEKQIRSMEYVRCVNCGSVDDSVILRNRLIERSTPCCTTH